jgi:hypothetical protein
MFWPALVSTTEAGRYVAQNPLGAAVVWDLLRGASAP